MLQKKGNLREDIAYLLKELNQPKGFRFLFRASEHQFKKDAFHMLCDNVENTLIIVRTEFGKTIAGYTHYKWNTTNSAYFYDSAKRTFLLQMDLYQKMVNVTGKNLIYCGSNQGPWFGHNDLGLRDNCNTASNSGYFPVDYNYEG